MNKFDDELYYSSFTFLKFTNIQVEISAILSNNSMTLIALRELLALTKQEIPRKGLQSENGDLPWQMAPSLDFMRLWDFSGTLGIPALTKLVLPNRGTSSHIGVLPLCVLSGLSCVLTEAAVELRIFQHLPSWIFPKGGLPVTSESSPVLTSLSFQDFATCSHCQPSTVFLSGSHSIQSAALPTGFVP